MNLSNLGLVHTLIAVVALAIGITSLVRRGNIEWDTRMGKSYTLLTILASLTAFGIFRTGSFGPGHVIAILTLASLAGAVAVRGSALRARKYIEVGLFSVSVLLSFIPAIVETFTRVPIGAPLATGPNDPVVGATIGTLSTVFLLLIVWQIFRLRKLSHSV